MHENKVCKLTFIFILILLIGSWYMSFDYFNEYKKTCSEKEYLQHDIDSLKAKSDSLENASNLVKPTNAVIIKEKIVTKYVKQYQIVANASANEAFAYLLQWIPYSDTLPKMVVTPDLDTCILVGASQLNDINTIQYTNVIYSEIIDTLLYNDSLRAEKERLLQAVISTRNEVIQKQDEQIKQSDQENSALKKNIERRQKWEKIAFGSGAGLLIITLFIK